MCHRKEEDTVGAICFAYSSLRASHPLCNADCRIAGLFSGLGSLNRSFATVGFTTEILGPRSSGGLNPTCSIGVTGAYFHKWRMWSLLVTDRE